jgi:hypothetical protein
VYFSARYGDALKRVLETGTWFASFDIDVCTVDLSLENTFEEHNYDGLGLLAVCQLRDIPSIVVSGHLTPSIVTQLQTEFGVKAIFDKGDFSGYQQVFLNTIERELTLQHKNSDKNDSHQTQDVDEILSTKRQSLLDGAMDSYQQELNHINGLQRERIKIRGRIDPDDDAQWYMQIKKLDERYNLFKEKIRNAKTQKEIEYLHRELAEGFLKW